MPFYKMSSVHGLGPYCRQAGKMGPAADHWSLGSCASTGFAKLVGYVAPPDGDAVYIKNGAKVPKGKKITVKNTKASS